MHTISFVALLCMQNYAKKPISLIIQSNTYFIPNLTLKQIKNLYLYLRILKQKNYFWSNSPILSKCSLHSRFLMFSISSKFVIKECLKKFRYCASGLRDRLHYEINNFCCTDAGLI